VCDRLVLISQDGADETNVLRALYDVRLPIVLDEGLDASRAFDPPSVPAFFLVGEDGRVERAHVSPRSRTSTAPSPCTA
jgi:hypothetical protein